MNGRDPADRRPTLVALAAVVVASVALWRRFHAAPPEPGDWPSDLINYFLPRAEWIAARLARGELPLWNPTGCGGFPDLATLQHAVFYPGTWANAVFGVAAALPARLFAECALGGGFAALLVRAWGLGAAPAALAGILTIGVCLLGQTFWPPEVSTLIWIPWLWLCVERLSVRLHAGWWLGLVAGTALQLLAGFPQFALYGMYLLVPWAALRLVETRGAAGPSALRRAAWLALGVALGAGVAGVQLAPTLELSAHSLRESPLQPRDVHYLGARGAPLSAVLGNLVDPAPGPLAFDFRGGGGYLGIATLLLVAVGGVALPLRRVLVLGGVAGLALLLSGGYEGPAGGLFRVYAALPGSDLFRTPERLRVLTWLAAIAVAAFGLDAAVRGLAGRGPVRAAAALGAGLVVAAAVAALGGPGAAWRAALGAALLLATWRLARVPRARWIAPAALVAFVALDVAMAIRPQGPLRNLREGWAHTYHVLGRAVATPEEVEALRAADPVARVALPAAMPYTASPGAGALLRAACYEPLAPGAWGALFRELGGAPGSGQLFLDVRPAHRERFYDLAAVSRVVQPPPAASPVDEVRAFRARWAARDAPLPPEAPAAARILPNPDALPRAYWVGHAETGSHAAILARWADPSADLRTRVWLEAGDAAASAPSHAGPVAARIVAHAPERVEVAVRAPAAGWLVLTDTFFPGWRARVDGATSAVYRANGVYRAVPVPPGRHRVVFDYAPRSLRLGALVSVASGITALGLFRALRRRPPASPDRRREASDARTGAPA